jgi:hypothetical protein
VRAASVMEKEGRGNAWVNLATKHSAASSVSFPGSPLRRTHAFFPAKQCKSPPNLLFALNCPYKELQKNGLRVSFFAMTATKPPGKPVYPPCTSLGRIRCFSRFYRLIESITYEENRDLVQVAWVAHDLPHFAVICRSATSIPFRIKAAIVTVFGCFRGFSIWMREATVEQGSIITGPSGSH